jgi:hypothetical protein
VIMPFGPEWSTAVYEAIKHCVASVDPTITVVRADEIPQPGRITEQIVHEIASADFVITDISGLNANVFWELGYSHALRQSTIILSQDVGSAPFDTRDYRMIEYSLPFDGSALELLAAQICTILNVNG